MLGREILAVSRQWLDDVMGMLPELVMGFIQWC
jgi:hypothetical protein